MEWRLSEPAERDLGDIYLGIQDRQSTARAEQVVAEIGATFDHLAQYPRSGMVSSVTSDVTLLEKVVPRQPYRIYYHIQPDGIVIARVLHTARRPPRRL